MVPSIGLEYSEGGPSGAVGLGWSIKGTSAITRCAASKVIDQTPQAPLMLGSDKLCLDGQRLIQTNAVGNPSAVAQTNDAAGLAGPVGVAFREFRTERDSYARIRAYGAIDAADLSLGPQYFRVWTKSGQVYHYGGGSPGAFAPSTASLLRATITQNGVVRQPAVTWAVSRITDAVGNYTDFVYTARQVNWGSGAAFFYGGPGMPIYTVAASGDEWNLAEIQYTGTPTQRPHSKIVFDYEDRPADFGSADRADRSETYFLNHKRLAVRRLIQVRTFVNSPNHDTAGPGPAAVAVRTLKLAYVRSASSGRSLLESITDCAGPLGTQCMPPTRYAYQNPVAVGYGLNSTFGGGVLAALPLMEGGLTPTAGMLTGDFNGDGRTDILRWSATPANNQLFFSTGGGGFQQKTNFDLVQTSHLLGDSAGCYTSIVADFNGDGLSDILRANTKQVCWPVQPNKVFLSRGDGTFEERTLSVTLLQSAGPYWSTEPLGCFGGGFLNKAQSETTFTAATDDTQVSRPNRVRVPMAPTAGLAPLPDSGSRTVSSQKEASLLAAVNSTCTYIHERTGATRFYLLDTNGDGILDIVTTRVPDYSVQNTSPTPPVLDEAQVCAAAGGCTFVHLGSDTGQFSLIAAPNVRNKLLYSDPEASRSDPHPYWRLPDQADLNADGLQDIISSLTGRWRSLGTGDFEPMSADGNGYLCGNPIDFNGDGRYDCLWPSPTASQQRLTVSYGAATSPAIPQFNLTAGDQNLLGFDVQGRQNVGMVIEDFDGDGRQDILRWGPTSADNGVHFSRGEGSFTSRHAAGLATYAPLQAADQSRAFALGDFLGDGTLQVLLMKQNPTQNGGNQLLMRMGQQGPQDVLTKVTTPNGLSATVDQRVPITASNFTNDRGNAGITNPPGVLDIQPPMYVIPGVTRQTGPGGQQLTSQFQFAGLKAERGGRGLLGFREFRQTDPGADGGSTATRVTEYLLKHPYTGLAHRTRALIESGGVSEQMSETLNVYCDKAVALANPDAATHAAPCPSSALVSRVYLRKSVDTGREITIQPQGSGSTLTPTFVAALPTVTTINTFNDWGDGTEVNVKTEAQVAGAPRVHERTTTNTVCEPDSTLPNGTACPNKIAGNQWVLGRNTRTTSRSRVLTPYALTPSAGTQPQAAAVVGNPGPGSPQLINPAVLSVIIQMLLED